LEPGDSDLDIIVKIEKILREMWKYEAAYPLNINIFVKKRIESVLFSPG
jgi:hypothetical protein